MAEAEADDTAAVLQALNEELAMMRGIRDPALAGAVLDFEAPPHPPPPSSAKAAYPTAADADDLSERRQEQRRASELAHAKLSRGSLEEDLRRRETEGREQRELLLGYLQSLRARDDETGEALRDVAFERAVDKFTSEGRSRRAHADDALRGGGARGDAGISRLLARTDDPKLREELLEVQRLDAVLAQAARKGGTSSARGTRGEGHAGAPPSASVPLAASAPPSPRGQPRLPLGTPTAEEDATFLTATGITEGKEGGGGAPPAPSAMPSHTSSLASGQSFRAETVTGRPLGAIWMSAADEARVKALLEEEDEDEDGADGEYIASRPGEGYGPPLETAQRLQEIDALLAQASVADQELDGILQPRRMNPLVQSSAEDGHTDEGEAVGTCKVGGHLSGTETSRQLSTTAAKPILPNYLEEMKAQRAEAQRLAEIQRRLNRLQAMANEENRPMEDEKDASFEEELSTHELAQLEQLLGYIRQESERLVDAATPRNGYKGILGWPELAESPRMAAINVGGDVDFTSHEVE
ncbi:hypothetical protein AB1Y20_011056 [Prymnesium parvum]|uniref:Fibrous sheath-interacting protein 1 n=1 Tax=Prymnesium parvum TaxID=97485 RepID=A0AB34IKR0_PRYPA